MSSLASEASLIVAAFELFAVRSVINAGDAADLESGDVKTPAGIIEKPEPAPLPEGDQYIPNGGIEERTVVVKEAIYSRPVHACCCVEPRRIEQAKEPREIPWCDVATEPAAAPTNPIQPPWKILPWMEKPRPHVVIVEDIKVINATTDKSGRGQMIDLVV